MIISSNIVGIIADDLTGANDTALQFKLRGADTNILLNTGTDPKSAAKQQTWAISTESRNVEPDEAFEKVKNATKYFVEKINPDFFYKKIDSTVRGNIAVEILAMLEVLEMDAAIVMPAFPQEGRTAEQGVTAKPSTDNPDLITGYILKTKAGLLQACNKRWILILRQSKTFTGYFL